MIAFDIHARDQVASTNSCIKELIVEGAPEGTVVMAKEQVGGYGRRGHAWVSPEGGLYLSILVRPRERVAAEDAAALMAKVPTLSLVTGLAVRQGLCRMLPEQAAEQIKVKWPNDVMVLRDGVLAKLCGISLEGTPDALCLGVGVNVLPPEGAERDDRCAYALDLAEGAEVTVSRAAHCVLGSFAEHYEAWLAQPFSSFLGGFEEANALAGCVVAVREGSEVIEGSFAGVDEHGRMLLRQHDGAIRAIVSGEAHIERFA